MPTPAVPVRPYDDVRYLTYRFDPDAAISVSLDDIIQPGDTIARAPMGAAFVALADELHLAAATHARMIARLDGETLEAGERFGTQRVGLVTRVSQAPVAGTAVGLPESGALGLRPSGGETEVRARAGGIVAETAPGRMSIASQVRCVPFAFATGNLPEALTLAAPTEQVTMAVRKGMTVPVFAPNALSVFAHLSSVADMAALRKRPPGAVVIGSVPDSVAWELLMAETERAPARGTRPALIVLAVTDDPAVGAGAANLLRACDGLSVSVERERRLLVIHRDTVRIVIAHAGDDRLSDEAGVFRDPAHWDIPCIVHAPPFVTTLASGLRVLVCRTTSETGGAEVTPVSNLALLARSED